MTRSVLVTGASKGIGQAIACQLAHDGFDVVVHFHRDLPGAEETLKHIESNGGKGRLLSFDVSQRQTCREIIEDDIAVNGAYYGVVNNAGITRDGAFPALSEGDWDSVIHTNLDSFYNVLHPCVMPMIGLRQGGTDNRTLLGFWYYRQSWAGELQCCEGRHYRGLQGAGAGIGETQNHGQLYCSRSH